MTGSVLFSVDAELYWGTHDESPLTEEMKRRYSKSRERWRQLLRLFEEFDIPATWAVVGHLLTDEKAYRAEHPIGKQWFERADIGLDTEPELWLGRDLIAEVVGSTVDNELASHSFSHAIFPEIDSAAAATECRLAREIGTAHGYDFTSFVFPRNQIAHRDVLAETGFDCYRGYRPYTIPAIPGIRGLSMLAGGLTGSVSPPSVTPRVDDVGLVGIPASIFLGGFRGRPWSTLGRFGEDPAVTLTKRGIDRTAENGELFHMWLHPHDLTETRYVDRIRNILHYVSEKRSRGDIRIETMETIAQQVIRNQDSPVRQRSPHPGEAVIQNE